MHRFITIILLAAVTGLTTSFVTTAGDDDRSEINSDRVTVTETDDSIVISVGQQPVLRYNKTNTRPPQGIKALFARSGYIHPVYSPSGRIVTGHYADDHPHQSGVFNAWVSTEFQGHSVDFWNKAKRKGRVSHEQVLSTQQDGDSGSLGVTLIHEDITDPDHPVSVLRETWDVVVHQDKSDGFVIDLTSTQICIADSPLLIKQHHYGGMAVRGTSQWYDDASAAAYRSYLRASREETETNPPGIDQMKHAFLTSDGLGRFDGNHARQRWVDMHGPIDGEAAGIALMAHETNFRSPQPVRLHPNKPYFCFSPPVVGDFELKPGESYVSRYRLVIHDGQPNVAVLNDLYRRFHAKKEKSSSEDTTGGLPTSDSQKLKTPFQ